MDHASCIGLVPRLKRSKSDHIVLSPAEIGRIRVPGRARDETHNQARDRAIVLTLYPPRGFREIQDSVTVDVSDF